MAFYEHIFMVRQDVTPAQVDALVKQFSDLVKEQGGKVKKVESWGLRPLAYRIKKNRKAHYVLFNIDAPPSALSELERVQSLNEDILRVLTVRVDQLEEGHSVVLRARREEGEEGGHGERPSFSGPRERRFSGGARQAS